MIAKFTSLFFIALSLIFAQQAKKSEQGKISYLYTNDAPVGEVLKLLSYVTKTNLNATASLNTKKINSIYRNLSIKEIVKEISNTFPNTVPHYDKSIDTYKIVLLSEYNKIIGNIRNEYRTEFFSVRPVNLTTIATGIEEIYGSRVQFSLGGEIFDFSSSGNNQSRSGSSSSSSKGTSQNQTSQEKEKIPSREDVLEQFDGKVTNIPRGEDEELPILMTINREHSAIIIRTKDEGVLKEIKNYISVLDLPVKQVLLEMQILDISLNDGRAFGADLNLNPNTNKNFKIGGNFSTNFRQGVAAESNSLLLDYVSGKYNFRLVSAIQENKLETIASPVIIAMNNRESSITIGQQRQVITGFSASTREETQAGIITTRGGIPELSEETIGTELIVIPRIFNNNYLNLYVDLSVDTLGNPVTINGENVDTINRSSFNSSILAKTKEIVAIGGIIREEDIQSKKEVPFLSKIPIIGNLFKSEEKTKLRSELILLVRPHILTSENPQDSLKALDESLNLNHSKIPNLKNNKPKPILKNPPKKQEKTTPLKKSAPKTNNIKNINKTQSISQAKIKEKPNNIIMPKQEKQTTPRTKPSQNYQSNTNSVLKKENRVRSAIKELNSIFNQL